MDELWATAGGRMPAAAGGRTAEVGEGTATVDAAVDAVAEDFDTPAYVYDLAEVRRAHLLLRTALPRPSRLYYSLKANPHPSIVGALHRLGCLAEVCSPGELAGALAAGVPPGGMLYTGPGKRDPEVAAAVRAGVAWFSVDSPTGLEQVDRAAVAAGTSVRCLLRVNGDVAQVPGQGLAMTGVASAFGADTGWIARSPAAFAGRGAAELAGLHLYLGSNLTDEDALCAQFDSAIGCARRVSDVLGTEPRLLNIGGGFGAPYARAGELPALPTLAGRVAGMLDAAFSGWRAGRPTVAFESGRFLTATCGALLTRVLDVKWSHGRPVVVLESGINHLGGMSGLRRLPPIVPDLAPAGGTATGHAVGEASGAGPSPVLDGAIVAGPLCTPLDTWARGARLAGLRPGDLVRVPNVGAYGLSASLIAFLGHPAPREVVVDGGRVVHASRLVLRRGFEHTGGG